MLACMGENVGMQALKYFKVENFKDSKKVTNIRIVVYYIQNNTSLILKLYTGMLTISYAWELWKFRTSVHFRTA
jgi:hypothetical protein